MLRSHPLLERLQLAYRMAKTDLLFERRECTGVAGMLVHLDVVESAGENGQPIRRRNSYLGAEVTERRGKKQTYIPRASAFSQSKSLANTEGTRVIGVPTARWWASTICWAVSGSAARPTTL
jgi:hypothetical protein